MSHCWLSKTQEQEVMECTTYCGAWGVWKKSSEPKQDFPLISPGTTYRHIFGHCLSHRHIQLAVSIRQRRGQLVIKQGNLSLCQSFSYPNTRGQGVGRGGEKRVGELTMPTLHASWKVTAWFASLFISPSDSELNYAPLLLLRTPVIILGPSW